MSSTIALLPDDTIDQIAAGEVVESPASVVKELIENALDAGAENIEVEIVGGGLKKISVSDDGKGMNREDVQLSIRRHATSKIRTASDLLRLSSMGFRGEALAAISSISRFTLHSAEKGITGTKVVVEGGKVKKVGPAPRKRGTTVIVEDLFYNVPARKKFQKSAAALSAEIYRMLTILSLSHPDVGFLLISNSRKAFVAYSLEGVEKRAKAFLGNEFLERATKIKEGAGGMEIKGLIGAPQMAKANRLGQYIFINKRAVECRVIEEAVRAGLSTRLDEKKHPQFLLYCQLPPDLVDANVHPQKLQVRLRDEETVFKMIKELVGKTEVRAPKMEFSGEPFSSPSFLSEELDFEVEKFHEEPKLQIGNSVIGLYAHYLLLAEEEALIFVDLKAARFRLIFNEMLEEKGSSGKQGLLLPRTLEFTPVETTMLLSHLQTLEKLGFELKGIGGHLFMMHAIPSFLTEEQSENALREMAGMLPETIGQSSFEKERLRKLSMIAARYGKEKGTFSLDEAKALFAKVKDFADDPKGEPIQMRMSKDAIEKTFEKIPATTT